METRAAIAVVEDEITIASSIAKRLRAEGYRVEVAHDGPSGVALCRRLHPDLVILDLMLPGMDGLEACRRVQQDRHVPVLMLTARDDETTCSSGSASALTTTSPNHSARASWLPASPSSCAVSIAPAGRRTPPRCSVTCTSTAPAGS
jgi:CheY-like chemotaxis protein